MLATAPGKDATMSVIARSNGVEAEPE